MEGQGSNMPVEEGSPDYSSIRRFLVALLGIVLMGALTIGLMFLFGAP